MLDNSRNRFEFNFIEDMLQSLEENGIKLVSFTIELMQRQEEQSRLTALSLDASKFKLHTLRSDKAHCTKADNASRLLFKRFCSRNQLTDGAAFL